MARTYRRNTTNTALIEWFIISGNIKEYEHRGRLLEPKIVQHNISNKIVDILKKYSIYYEYDETNNLYVIYVKRQKYQWNIH